MAGTDPGLLRKLLDQSLFFANPRYSDGILSLHTLVVATVVIQMRKTDRRGRGSFLTGLTGLTGFSE